MADEKPRVFGRTSQDEEKLAEAIANLEMVDHQIRQISGLESPHKDVCLEVARLVRKTLDYLRGIEVKNEIEDYSHFDDIKE